MQIKATPAQALKRRYPEQVVLVTTRNAGGRANIMAVGWVTLAADDPLMFLLGIDDAAYTYQLIRQTREFVVAWPGTDMAPAVLYAGSQHGHRLDKLAHLRLPLQDGLKVRAPLIKEAVANFECKLVRIYQPGNCPLIVGQVLAAHVHRRAARRRLYTVGPHHALGALRVHRHLSG